MAPKSPQKPPRDWREFWIVAAAISTTLFTLMMSVDYLARHLIIIWKW